MELQCSLAVIRVSLERETAF